MDYEPPPRVWTAALVLLCVGALWLQFGHIESTMPYPRHVDEAFISGPAHRTVVTGTLHPYTFNYPSLPKYVAAAGMAIGFVRGAADRETRDIQRLGNVGYPYYENRTPMRTARQLFALLSVVALAATALSAWIAFQRPLTILLAPIILLASPLFFFHSWTYLNVDIVGTCCVMLAVAACLLGTRRPSIHQSAIIPGVFAGLAAGSKYTLALVALPVLLAIGLTFTGSRRTWSWAAALAAMAGAFFVAVPYSLIDIPGFLNGLASEAFHYASGHRGFQSEPGLPQLVYYGGHLVSEFGLVAIVLAVLGFASFAVADWRRAAVLAIFPVALLWLLASQRVHFPRNVLPLHPFLSMFAALGVAWFHRRVMKLAARRPWSGRGPWRPLVPALAGVILVSLAVPLWHVSDLFRTRTDSRNVAREWIEERLPSDWTIVAPTQLGFDGRALQAKGRRVITVDLRSARDSGTLESLLRDVPAPAVILAPRWGADPRYPGQELAPALNDLARRWRALKTFGTNEVLVNYSYSTPWGDPAFAIASLK